MKKQNKHKKLENETPCTTHVLYTAEFRSELPSSFVEQSLGNDIEARYWKTKHLAPHMYCTAEFKDELPSLLVEQSLVNDIETRYWKTKPLTSYTSCTAVFKGELPSSFVEHAVFRAEITVKHFIFCFGLLR